MTTAQGQQSTTKATVRDTVGVVAGVMAPTLARGIILRRPMLVALAERLDLDRRAVQRLLRLRERYGAGPLELAVPIRRQAVVLAPEHVHQVLDGTPEPFSAGSDEKVAALAHFQPKGVLVSEGADRTDRRRFNEAVLDTDNPVHELGPRFAAVVEEEARELLVGLPPSGILTWDDFAPAWFRVVRRVTFGDAAADDHEITEVMAKLRAAANWAFARPKRPELRARLLRQIEHYLQQAEPGSLAAVMARTPVTERTAPVQQVPQWLFAFDPAGMTTMRALALVASHPAPAERARAEAAELDGGRLDLPFLRACVLESLRLWPTTPAVLRQTTRPVHLDGARLRSGTGVFIFAPLFHRDATNLDEADRFAPELWLEHRDQADWPLIPFSGGPAMCPGRNLVLLTTSHFLGRLIDRRAVRLERPRDLGPHRPLPGTLNNYGLRFRVAR
jgi:cytochrome P450